MLTRRTALKLVFQGIALSGLGVTACDDRRVRDYRLGCNSWLGYAPLYLARSQGILDEIAIRLVEIPTSSAVLRALRNGNIEFAALTLDEVIRVRASGAACKVLWVADFSAGGDAIVAQSGLTDFKMLAGKRVGVEDTALGAYVLQRAFDLNHMKVSDIEIVRMTPTEQERAFFEGLVDAVVTFEPYLSHLKELGAVEVFTSKQIPWEIIDVIVAREDIVEQDFDTVKALADAWFGILGDIIAGTDAAIENIQQREDQSAAAIRQALTGIHFPDRETMLSVLDNTNGLEQAIQRLMVFQSERDPKMTRFAPSEVLDIMLCRQILGAET